MRTVRRVAVLCVLAFAMTSLPAQATDVGLDPTFSDDGRVFVGERFSSANSLVRYGGDVYAAGTETIDKHSKLFVSKLDDNGVPDPTFGVAGRQLINGQGERYFLTGLTVDDSGRVLLVAQSRHSTLVVRLTADGALDITFSGDGRRLLPGGAATIFLDPDVVIDSQGRLIVAAMVDTGSPEADVRVWRLLDDGTLDTSWSGDGLRTINEADTDWMDAVAVDARDRVLIGSDYAQSGALIYRLQVNGSLDSTFSDDGVATFRLVKKAWTFPLRIDVGLDEQITVAAAGFGDNLYGSARLTADGQLDRSYGDAGVIGLTCQLECLPTWGDASGGKVAILVDPYGWKDGRLRIALIGKDGTDIEQLSVDPFSSSDAGSAYAIEIDGQRTLIAGDNNKRAFVARLE